MVVKPQILPGSSDESGEDNEGPPAVARTLDVESPFSIEPQNGVLEASGIANFTLTFAPPEVGSSEKTCWNNVYLLIAVY